MLNFINCEDGNMGPRILFAKPINKELKKLPVCLACRYFPNEIKPELQVLARLQIQTRQKCLWKRQVLENLKFIMRESLPFLCKQRDTPDDLPFALNGIL